MLTLKTYNKVSSEEVYFLLVSVFDFFPLGYTDHSENTQYSIRLWELFLCSAVRDHKWPHLNHGTTGIEPQVVGPMHTNEPTWSIISFLRIKNETVGRASELLCVTFHAEQKNRKRMGEMRCLRLADKGKYTRVGKRKPEASEPTESPLLTQSSGFGSKIVSFIC